MNTKTKAQGTAIYRNETVIILDVLYVSSTNKTEVMINYGGPVWVNMDQLTNIVWSI